MSQRRSTLSQRCQNCQLNKSFCVCEAILPLQIKNQISLIVHVSELKLSSNTAQFVKKLIPDQTTLYIRGHQRKIFNAQDVLNKKERALFLFPDEEAHELNSHFLAKYPGPYNLVVPDGNWNQAKKVLRRESQFKDVIKIKLPPGIVGQYKLRKAPKPGFLSTFEAIAFSLGIIEDLSIQEQMLIFFRHWVETTLRCRTGNTH